MILAMLVAVLVQSAVINNHRDAFIACLERAVETAKVQKLTAETVEPHLRSTCAAAEASFEASLVAFDVKNKVSRKLAIADAKLQSADFVTSSAARYKPALASN